MAEWKIENDSYFRKKRRGYNEKKRGGEMFVRKGWNMGEWRRRKNNFLVGNEDEVLNLMARNG